MIKINQPKKAPRFFKELDNLEVEYSASYFDDKDSFETNMLNFYNCKCLYCETTMEESEILINYFRPVNGALNVLTGEYSDKHYRWLSREWSNFILICEECLRNKSNRFPIKGNFMRLHGDESDLLNEKRLLINPFLDFPEKHFYYDEEGYIIPTSEKGRVTIDVLNLNRNKLVQQRLYELEKFKYLCEKLSGFLENTILNMDRAERVEEIVNGISGKYKYTGIKRFYLTKLIRENRIIYYSEFEIYLKGTLKKKNKIILPINNRTSFQEFSEEIIFQQEVDDDYDVTEEEDKTKYYYKQRYIEYVEVRNFKGINDIKLDFRNIGGKNAPWLMLLGENGYGKTSILQAISLALMGEKKRNKILSGSISDFIKNGEQRSTIHIEISGMFEPIKLNLHRNFEDISGENYKKPRVLLLAYGATRLLPNASNNYSTEKWARIENLFNAFIPLVDVRSYLLSLEGTEFEVVTKAIKEVFFEDVHIFKQEDEIYFEFKKAKVNINNLSDGYKNIIALVTDIMMVMKNRWRNFDAEGIVLIDELDAHLHPRWNIDIVSKLRKVFPKIQFIATTHNPLTLRGLEENEIAVLKSEDENMFTLQSLPNQKELEVEELLTSKYFGLYDTNPEINKYFDEYYSLLANPNPNEKNRTRIKTLEHRLDKFNKIGNTKRDKLFYKVIDRFISYERKLNKEFDMKEFDKEVDYLIKKIKGNDYR